MKLRVMLHWVTLLAACCFVTGCQRSSDQVWDDTRTASRHVGNGLRTLFGKGGDSRQIYSLQEFAVIDAYNDEFIPLEDEDLTGQIDISEAPIRQAREIPGEEGGMIPGIEGFTPATGHPGLGAVFQTIHFPYNSDLIKGRDKHDTVQHIADYMQDNPNVYIFVEGHCDERGTAAYNLALGSRRSNSVRNMLIRLGVDMDRVFTVSYGKEKPVAGGHTEDSWWQNRRAEFRIFHKA